MSKKIVLLIALIAFSSAFAQNWNQEKIKGNGIKTTLTRTTAAYDKISTSGSFLIELISGKEGSIIIKGDENIIENIITEVVDNELKVYFKKNKSYNYKQNISITIPFEDINELTFEGSGNLSTKNEIIANTFVVKMSGSGNCKLAINTKKISAKMAGSGNLTLTGTTEEVEAKASGSGNLNGSKLISKNADVSVAGSGSLELFCFNKLVAKVAGSGSITYKGNPKSIDSDVVGSGDISGN